MDRPRLHAGESHADGPLGPLTHAYARSRIGDAVAYSDELRQVAPSHRIATIPAPELGRRGPPGMNRDGT